LRRKTQWTRQNSSRRKLRRFFKAKVPLVSEEKKESTLRKEKSDKLSDKTDTGWLKLKLPASLAGG